MISVIKTTLAISDTGTSKPQCVTMRTKDFRKCQFLRRFCALRQLWKDLLSRIKPTLGFGSGFNYLKILANNRKCSNTILIHSFKKSMYRKSTKVFLNLMQASSLRFPNNLNLQFWLLHIICLFNFKICQNWSFFSIVKITQHMQK